jgi:hypothetical protein
VLDRERTELVKTVFVNWLVGGFDGGDCAILTFVLCVEQTVVEVGHYSALKYYGSCIF